MRATERERDSKFVELGRYLCEVRAGQYWRVDNVRSFDEFLERKFPKSRRKAYYLMAIHEQLPRIHKVELQHVGWTKATELAKVARRDGQRFDCATWLHKGRELPKDQFKREASDRSSIDCPAPEGAEGWVGGPFYLADLQLRRLSDPAS